MAAVTHRAPVRHPQTPDITVPESPILAMRSKHFGFSCSHWSKCPGQTGSRKGAKAPRKPATRVLPFVTLCALAPWRETLPMVPAGRLSSGSEDPAADFRSPFVEACGPPKLRTMRGIPGLYGNASLPPNDTVNRAAANRFRFQKPRGPRLRLNRLLCLSLIQIMRRR